MCNNQQYIYQYLACHISYIDPQNRPRTSGPYRAPPPTKLVSKIFVCFCMDVCLYKILVKRKNIFYRNMQSPGVGFSSDAALRFAGLSQDF